MTATNTHTGRTRTGFAGIIVTFDFAVFHSWMASRKNDDGTTSFVTIDPTVSGFPFVVGTQNGKRTLTVRDGQHEYVYVEN